MKKLVRVAVFALLMAGAVTVSFSSNAQASLTPDGPVPMCPPDVPFCNGAR